MDFLKVLINSKDYISDEELGVSGDIVSLTRLRYVSSNKKLVEGRVDGLYFNWLCVSLRTHVHVCMCVCQE